MVTTQTSIDPRTSVARVLDPEVPVLTIEDLGILRDVIEHPTGQIEVVITPTYSGCPAMDRIRSDILEELATDGHHDVLVTTVLSPAWTTDWMSEEGKRKLHEYGIAPPRGSAPSGPVAVTIRRAAVVPCPQCGGEGRESSRFGSTACKAQYVCTSCSEPFDYFKTI